MKRVLKKLVIILLITIIISNYCIMSSYAATSTIVDDIIYTFTDVLGLVVGILTSPMRWFALGAGWAIDKFSALVAYTEGATDSSVDTSTITPFDIFFNKVKLVDINFFDIGTESNFINTMRTSVASWYYIMRIIAASILLVILIYVGIRMAISTVASDRAMYKKMLVDWVCSLALVFLLHYIIIFVITVNNSIVSVIENSVDNTNVSNTYKEIRDIAGEHLFLANLDNIGATIIYIMLIWQTFGIIVSYFNRMLKVAFLIIISPLVTITYSIDKMGDGKAQALNLWLKEIVFTILIQPFHCIIYMCLIDTAFNLLAQPADNIEKLSHALVAIIMIRFIKEGEKIIRNIFDFKDDNNKTSVAMAMATTGVLINQAKNLGTTARNVGRGAANIGKGLANFRKNAAIETAALYRTVKNRGTEGNSFSNNKEQVIADRADTKAKSIMRKKGYSIKAAEDANKDTQILKSDIESEKQNILAQSNGTIKPEHAEKLALLNVVKKKKKENGRIYKKITGVKGNISRFKEKVGNRLPGTTEVLSTLGDLGKDYMKLSVAGTAGFVVGAGLYGTGKDIFSSVGIGAAVGKGTYDLGQKSKKTLSNNISKYLNNLGATNAIEGRKVINNVLNEKDKYGDGENATKEREKILKDLQTALQNFGIDGDTVSTISNAIKSDLTNNPAMAPDIIKNRLSHLKDSQGKKIPFAKISKDDKVDKVLEYSNMNAIYNEIQTGETINISSGDLMEESVSIMEKTDSYYLKVDEFYYSELQKQNDNDEKAKLIANENFTDKEISRILSKYEDEINSIEQELKSPIDKTQKKQLEGIRNNKELEKLEVITKALAQKAGELTEYQEKLYQNLRDEIERKQSEENYASIETQLKVLENDLNTMVSRQKKTQ